MFNTDMAGLSFELKYPMIEYCVCDLLVLSFAAEALRNHTTKEIIPKGNVFAKLVLFINLFSSLLDKCLYFFLERNQANFIRVYPIKKSDNIFC